MYTRQRLSCARLQAVAIHFSRKTFRHLAPPNLALMRLQSLDITLICCQLCIASLAAPTHTKKRNAPLTIRGFATPPCLAHAHMQRKEMYFAPPIPKHCANRTCNLGSWFLHTSHVYDLTLIIHLSWHGALLRFGPHQKGGAIDNQMRPCHHCSNSKTLHPYMLW